VQGKATFDAVDGMHEAFILGKQDHAWNVSLRMKDVTRIEVAPGHYVLDTGSPHYVAITSSLDTYEVVKEGRSVRNSEPFSKNGINVNFIEFRNGGTAIRTYERGVEDETLSCGTGSVAAAIVTELNGRKNPVEPVTVFTRGGQLKVKFKTEGDEYTDIWLEGPAEFVFDGSIYI
jgi:diaminopimelate epimerase